MGPDAPRECPDAAASPGPLVGAVGALASPPAPREEPAPRAWSGLAPLDVPALGAGEVLVWDGVLGAARAHALAAALCRAAQPLAPAWVGHGSERRERQAVRGDRTRWLERTSAAPERWLWELFEHVARELCEKAWLGVHELEVQLACFPGDAAGAGAGYAPHRDSFAGGGRRRAAAVYYLNPDWRPEHAGELRVWTPSGVQSLAPAGDRLVVWLTDLVLHEVLPTRAARWAATAWFLGPGL